MFKKLKEKIARYKKGTIGKETLERMLASYTGVLSHANAFRLTNTLKNQFWFWMTE